MNEVSFQHGFVECFMCAGRGIISERMCNCGRPLVWYCGAFASCNNNECYQKAKDCEKKRLEKVVDKNDPKILSYPDAY